MKKIALVTGASSGIGEATARKFAENGFAVILAARSEDKLKLLAESLQSSTDVYAARLDVTDPASIDAFFDGLPEAFQAIEVLVNNAGILFTQSKLVDIDRRMRHTWKTGKPWYRPTSWGCCE